MGKRRYPIHPEQWLLQFAEARNPADAGIIKQAIQLYDNKDPLLLEKGLAIADILLSLGLDTETLAASLVYPALQAKKIHADSIVECLGEDSGKLLHDVLQMQSLDKLQHLPQRGSGQIENLRKMLLAMVTDVRSVLVILAERLWQLRQAKQLEINEQQKLAAETLAVHAPLANRLGIWQLKWEIEDLCLRYLHPQEYSKIAKGIAARRDDREAYVHRFITILQENISQSGIKNFQVTGRVKHIYSIYKKMLRKNADIQQIYDMSALRVLVQTIEDCYRVLAVLQNSFEQIPEEFDDYISQPKPNGYQSIHIVLIGPDNVNVEVQIRTFQMHQESELGIAAHWRYKEGVLQPVSSYESKIVLLRQIMAWQKEVVNEQDEAETRKSPTKDLFKERVYVFTPMGDIVDLPQGATPLDFAYAIHSEVGHRCRGAKVDGHIVPLTYELMIGQRVEILTAKEANPSRDWLNPHLKYLKSARSRAKVQHWFKIKDSLQSAPEKEVKKPEIYAKIEPPIETRTHSAAPDIHILGINNLLTHIARCCRPLPGDAVIGYITKTRGVSIHKRTCRNINAAANNTNRKIEVNWGGNKSGTYAADLFVRVYDREGLLRDITTMLASEKINVASLKTQKTHDSLIVDIYLTIEILSRDQIKKALDHLKKLPNVIQARYQ